MANQSGGAPAAPRNATQANTTTRSDAAGSPSDTAPLPTVNPSRAPMIQVQNVTKQIGEKTLVENLNFDVGQGEIFGFIGPSGSGKTSTIRLLTGVYAPTQGTVRVMGVAPTHPSRMMQERFGYMPQLFVLYPNLTVRENLKFVAGLYGLSPFTRGKRIEQLLKFVELWDARDRLAEKISGGMQRRLELASSLLHNPALMFVDEPTAGIDPVLRAKFWEEFRRLRDQGRTLFVTTQYVGESEYCDRVGVIRKGRLIALDTPVELRRTALGGDVIDIEATGLTTGVVHALRQPDLVRDVRSVGRNQLRVYVDDASMAIPVLLDVMNEGNCDVSKIDEYRPSFDEIFIELMNKDAAERGEDESVDGPA
jgi:ABC-2 type transport system ATP-binding protein